MLDTGAVTALAPADARRRARLQALKEAATSIVIPAAVLAEGLLTGHPGHDFPVRRLLKLLEVADVDKDMGLAAGLMRARAIQDGSPPPPSGVDATVAALADERAVSDDVTILTSDGGDLKALTQFAKHKRRIAIVRV